MNVPVVGTLSLSGFVTWWAFLFLVVIIGLVGGYLRSSGRGTDVCCVLPTPNCSIPLRH